MKSVDRMYLIVKVMPSKPISLLEPLCFYLLYILLMLLLHCMRNDFNVTLFYLILLLCKYLCLTRLLMTYVCLMYPYFLISKNQEKKNGNKEINQCKQISTTFSLQIMYNLQASKYDWCTFETYPKFCIFSVILLIVNCLQ